MAVISKNLFTYNNLIHAVSGAVGSVIGMVVFYPLDTVRSRLQLEERRSAKNTFKIMKDLIREEGFSTLYRGIVPVLQSICVSNFVYFYVYHGLKKSFPQKKNMELLFATLAGVVNVLLTSPLWMVNTRMKMAGVTNEVGYKNLLEGLIMVSKKEGCSALWSGTIPSLILVSNPAIHMAFYEFLKKQTRSNTALSYFVFSAISKVAATVLTYPVQLAQAKQRHGNSEHMNKDMIKILLYILRKDGLNGLFKGMEAKILQTVLTTALMFTCYEKIAAFVFQLMAYRKPIKG
ncbi:peroxisomal membrane protein PMP34 [Halyomorpha halys]|uniref:peroxisomal membrane protein PMP34 n=1 Tax=Halyomorpha halys TaxID=286706 RepID=UPI0006D4D9F9|nr:peroxisomal membrane protein PMP34 [Halyomorpha halys]KAE8573657.1 hypothetical protein A483_HHAL011785 [Halyomorpha halys]